MEITHDGGLMPPETVYCPGKPREALACLARAQAEPGAAFAAARIPGLVRHV